MDPLGGICLGGRAWEMGRTGWKVELWRGMFSGGRMGGDGRGIGAGRGGGDIRGMDMGGMRIGGPPKWPPRWAHAGAASKAARASKAVTERPEAVRAALRRRTLRVNRSLMVPPSAPRPMGIHPVSPDAACAHCLVGCGVRGERWYPAAQSSIIIAQSQRQYNRIPKGPLRGLFTAGDALAVTPGLFEFAAAEAARCLLAGARPLRPLRGRRLWLRL